MRRSAGRTTISKARRQARGSTGSTKCGAPSTHATEICDPAAIAASAGRPVSGAAPMSVSSAINAYQTTGFPISHRATRGFLDTATDVIPLPASDARSAVRRRVPSPARMRPTAASSGTGSVPKRWVEPRARSAASSSGSAKGLVGFTSPADRPDGRSMAGGRLSRFRAASV